MKYQDLKVRIEALTGNSTLKEVDDIAQEVRNLSKKGGLSLEISLASDNAGFIRISHCKNEVAQFNSNFQCEKLVALKDALMWLLDHSELAKEKLVGREIEADYNGTKIVAKVLRVVG